MSSSLTLRRLDRLERRYRPAVLPAEEVIIYGGPDAAGPMRCYDGKLTHAALPDETLRNFRMRIAADQGASRWLIFYGLPPKVD